MDGGGTKSVLSLADTDGNSIESIRFGSTAYREIGVGEVCRRVADETARLLTANGVDRSEIAAAALGMPGYEENPDLDAILKQTLTELLTPIPLILANDVVVGYYGALGGKPGIEIVAGTGSIAYGEDGWGNHARCGGWSQFFSDEGSCYWAGIQAMALFACEADGRAERGALYDQIRAHYALKDDFEFVARMETEILPSREKTAAFQIRLSDAAQSGDLEAVEVYRTAARELVRLAEGVRNRLQIEGQPDVVVTGGMRRVGALLLEPLQELLKQAGMRYIEPLGNPVDGAFMLARKNI
jgi:N-acetylglucosamine kinase-like BadF-type ATPase